jgi:phosphoglycolate phosphatase
MNESMKKKLLLFDIDGTLILTGGVAARLMAVSVSEIAGIPVSWTMSDFVGNTDRNIVMTLLNRCGIAASSMNEMTGCVMESYLNKLKIEIVKDGVVTILPGVTQFLHTISTDSRFALGLLTGNVREGARLKLSVQRLYDYFPAGAFGDDAVNREDLPPIAIRRAEKHFGQFFERQNIWIIGDSVHDIRCAHANRLRSLAVASGHTPEQDLLKYKPSGLLRDLKDFGKIMDILLS